MKIEEQIRQKLEEAIDILKKFGMPSAQQNERTAYCLLSLLNVTPEKEWKNAESPLVGITPMMTFAKKYYNKEYAPNTRATFRRFSTHQMVQAGIVVYNPDKPDRSFVDTMVARHGMSERAVYADLAVIKQLLPALQSSSREWHRWKANQMLLETYEQAKRRHDTKTMERAAASYAKFNRVDLEDEQVIPYEDIVVQPFTATSDPTVLGIKPIENLDEVVKSLIAKYRQETLDIEDVEYEEADLEEKSLFGNETVEPHLLQ